MRVFFVVLDSCPHTTTAFKMLNRVISKRNATVVSVEPGVFKYKFDVGKQTIHLEVVVVEACNPRGGGNTYIHKVSKISKRNISAYPDIIKMVGRGANTKGISMDPEIKRTGKNFLKFLREDK